MKLFFQALFIIFFMTALLFWSFTAFTPASAKTLEPRFIPITMQNGKPHFSRPVLTFLCKKNKPCFAVKNETKQKVYFWWIGTHHIPTPINTIKFVGTVLDPGESKTFTLNDQQQDPPNSEHFFRIWYPSDKLNHDMLDVQTF